MDGKWAKVLELMREINVNNFDVFNDNIVYHYFRRFDQKLPFNFETHIEKEKKRKGTKFLERSEVLKEIFSRFPLEVKANVVDYYIYKFHLHKVSKRRILKLEQFLDNNREELFSN